jgi:hypothetical protein
VAPDASQPAAECAAAQLAAAEVRVSVAPLVDDSLPVGCLVELPADDLAPDDCSAAPQADDSPRACSADLVPDDCSVVALADDSVPDDSPLAYSAELPADDSPPVG